MNKVSIHPSNYHLILHDIYAFLETNCIRLSHHLLSDKRIKELQPHKLTAEMLRAVVMQQINIGESHLICWSADVSQQWQ